MFSVRYSFGKSLCAALSADILDTFVNLDVRKKLLPGTQKHIMIMLC